MEKPRTDWRANIAAYKTSGKTQRAWCKQNNINYNTFKSWLQKEKKETDNYKQPAKWLEIGIDQSDFIENTSSLTIQIGAASFTVKPGFDRQLLLDVVKTLVAIC